MFRLLPRPHLLVTGATALAAMALCLPSAVAQGAGSGLAISPPVIEQGAALGAVGSVTVTNATGETMKITVSARPWLQSASGAVSPDPRHTFSSVSLSPSYFLLPSGSSQKVSVGLLAVPPKGSLYGNVDVLGVPTVTPRGQVKVEYRLIGTLRLDPSSPLYGSKAVAVRVSGTHRKGVISVVVRNTGNTVTPISGTVTLHGPTGSASGRIAPVRIVPGVKIVVPTLRLHSLLPAGSYTMTTTLTSGHVKSHNKFRVTIR